MNKTQLIEAVSEKTGIRKKDVKEIMESFFEVVTDTLKNKEPIKLAGFGTFVVAERAARKGRNPQTGKTIDIPAKKFAKFRPHGILKDLP